MKFVCMAILYPHRIMAECQEVTGAVELIKLQSSEGEIFEVSVRVAKVSRTLSTMLSGQLEK